MIARAPAPRPHHWWRDNEVAVPRPLLIPRLLGTSPCTPLELAEQHGQDFERHASVEKEVLSWRARLEFRAR
ncbi:MAG: hypothetical protein QXU97_03495 [Fervidicoccaceae archaeon]